MLAESLINAGAQITSSAINAAMGAKQQRKNDQKRELQRQLENSWYNRNVNAKFIDKANSQRMITRTSEAINKRNKEIAGTQAVLGGNEESVAAQRNQNNKIIPELASNILSEADDYTNDLEEKHVQNQIGFAQQDIDASNEKSSQIANATKALADNVSPITKSVEDIINKRKSVSNPIKLDDEYEKNRANQQKKLLNGLDNQYLQKQNNNLTDLSKKLSDEQGKELQELLMRGIDPDWTNGNYAQADVYGYDING